MWGRIRKPTGAAVTMESWRAKVPAILISWYSGSEGGHALADVLLGTVDASGRLPFSIPRDESHLPLFDIKAAQIDYDRWFGRHLLDKLGVPPAFPFGFGLSYTTFLLQEIATCQQEKEKLQMKVFVKNTGLRGGWFIAQVYGLPGVDDFPYSFVSRV